MNAISAFMHSILGDSPNTSPVDYSASIEAMANASREAQITQSNDMVTMAQTQAGTMELGILKSSQDRQLQTQVWLTERLDSVDTKLQVAAIQAKGDISAASNHHVARMEELRLDGLELRLTEAGRGAGSPDIPAPDFE